MGLLTKITNVDGLGGYSGFLKLSMCKCIVNRIYCIINVKTLALCDAGNIIYRVNENGNGQQNCGIL